MSTTDPSDNFSADSHFAGHFSRSAPPLQDGETVNFAAQRSSEPQTQKPSSDDADGSDGPCLGNLPNAETSSSSQADSAYSSRYVRKGELGRGGWGVVDRVLDRQLEREVAVKRITIPEHLSEEDKQQFLHEAKITSQLQHPGVVPVHELVVGADEQSTYYVMKLLEGDTLRHHIRKLHQNGTPGSANKEATEPKSAAPKSSYELLERITPLLERFVDICNAVAYAHKNGVVHRDLKPTNVMVGAFGETIVVDWGLALQEHEVTEEAEHTIAGGGASHPSLNSSSFSKTDGTVTGTPAYMSPEQARGEVLATTSSSDIYSLGIILWEIVVGRHPYHGRSVSEILEDVCEGKRPSLQQIQPLASKPLIAIIGKALQLQPNDRYLTASELAADVRQLMLGEPVSVHRESLLDRVGRWCRRNRSMVVSIAASTCILLVASVVFGYVIECSRKAEQAAKLTARAAHESAFNRLVESRNATDTWLIDLSGSLQFYPGLQPIRNQLLQDAIKQYEGIVAVQSNSADLDMLPADSNIRAKTKLEHARCQLRLGDLYFLIEQPAKSKTHFLSAETTLRSLAKQNPTKLTDNFNDVGIADWIRLEQCNVALGLAFHDPDRIQSAKFRAHRRWLQAFLPDDFELQNTVANESVFREKAVSAAVRLEMVVFRLASPDRPMESTTVTLKRAASWARWLAQTDDKPGSRRLFQTAQETLARFLADTNQTESANVAWGKLVSDLNNSLRRDAPRPDHLQNLAHARLMKLSTQTNPSTLDVAEYRAAIDELNLAWSLSDSDSFYRTNLAAAEFSLARTIIANSKDSEANPAEATNSTAEASQLLRRSLATRQELLRDEVTSVRLRNLAETHFALAKLITETNSAGANGSEGTNGSDLVTTELSQHLESADLAYQMLLDHGTIEAKDALDWYDLLTFQPLNSENDLSNRRSKWEALDRWLQENELDAEQMRRWQRGKRAIELKGKQTVPSETVPDEAQ